MYLVSERADQALVEIRIYDDITEHENQELVDLILRRGRSEGPVRLLVVYDTDPGLAGAENLYDNMRFAKQAGDSIFKMAVAGGKSYENTWVGLFGLFGGLQTAYFDQDRLEDALAWLKE